MRPRILVVVDDLILLLEGAPRGIEERFAQLTLHGGNVGIHVIMTSIPPLRHATANWVREDFTYRASLWVDEQAEYASVLGSHCEEGLLRNGDLVLTQPELPGLLRLHVPWVSEQACQQVVRQWTLWHLGRLLSGLVENPADAALKIVEHGTLGALVEPGGAAFEEMKRGLCTVVPEDVVEKLLATGYHQMSERR